MKAASAFDDDLGRLHAFRSLLGLEAHALPFRQGLEATTLDDGMMHEDIIPIRSLNEAVPFAVIEPFDFSGQPHFASSPPFRLSQDRQEVPSDMGPGQPEILTLPVHGPPIAPVQTLLRWGCPTIGEPTVGGCSQNRRHVTIVWRGLSR